MTLPVNDWQFWAVTTAFALALLWMLRATLPGSSSRRKKRTKKATLTLEGKAVGKK